MAATLVSRRYQLRVAEIYGLTGTVADSPYLRHGMRSSSSVAGAGARSAGHPGLIGITLAVILLARQLAQGVLGKSPIGEHPPVGSEDARLLPSFSPEVVADIRREAVDRARAQLGMR